MSNGESTEEQTMMALAATHILGAELRVLFKAAQKVDVPADSAIAAVGGALSIAYCASDDREETVKRIVDVQTKLNTTLGSLVARVQAGDLEPDLTKLRFTKPKE